MSEASPLRETPEMRAFLKTETAQARQQRIYQWQTDTRRRTLRVCMEVRHPSCLLHPPALQAAMAQALFEAGLPLAMGLEKSSRPMIHLGHPLPSGVEGLVEWMDVILREAPSSSLSDLAETIQHHCPDGIRILEILQIPNISSPVLELCRKAHWRWTCPSEFQDLARQRLNVFESSETFTIEKNGKVDGHKQIKHVEVRHLFRSMAWEEETFCFSTHIAPGEATNPVKILAGILGLEPAAIQGLVRQRVELREDHRLAHQNKYETKLHNIYEDAVLLDGGTSPQVIEEDDEPIVLEREVGKDTSRNSGR